MKTEPTCSLGCRGRALRMALALLACPAGAAAQQDVDSLRAEIARLTARVDSLSAQLARGGSAAPAPQTELERLRAAAAAAAAGGGAPAAGAAAQADQDEEQEFVGRQRSLQALNPEISVTADLLGHVASDDANHENFLAREFEISFVSNLDPYSRARIFVSRHTPGAEIAPFPGAGEEEAEFSVEEGYVEWVGLPAGLSLKLGRFQQQFGQMNRWHSHALMSQARSLPHLAFIGEEALAQTGASVHWLLPFGDGGRGGTYQATVEVTRSENEALYGESDRLAVLGHLSGFWILSPSLDLDLGLSWVNGSYEDATDFFDRNLVGAEMALTWRPPAQALYRGVTVRGGLMALDGLAPAAGADRAWGYWAATEARLSQRWLVGARADRVEDPASPDQTAWLLGPTVTWWQSEYVRLRLEYDLLGQSVTDSTTGRALLQVTVAMGPHKHETY